MNTELPEIKVLYSDDDLIAVEKPSGMLVHPYKQETNERVNLMKILRDQIEQYLYPVHRIDRPVSGIVLFGFNSRIVKELKSVWHSDAVIKEYLALVKGNFEEKGSFSFSLFDEQKQPQEAFTSYSPLEQFESVTLVKIKIKTGRRHQIRRHFSRRCANVIGDKKYGQGKVNRFFAEKFQLNRIFLHASHFSAQLPESGRRFEIDCPLPGDLNQVLDKLRGNPA